MTFLDRNRNHMEHQVFHRCRKSWQPCLLQPECFEALISIDSLFLSSCMAQEPSLSHSSFHPLSPHSVHHAGQGTMQHSGNISTWSSSSYSASKTYEKKKKKREARDASRAPNLQWAEVQQFLWSASSLWSHHRLGEQMSPSRRGTKEIIQREFI